MMVFAGGTSRPEDNNAGFGIGSISAEVREVQVKGDQETFFIHRDLP